MVKVSIITINLNNQEGLRKTIKSVVNQTFKDYEYIIIDGGSVDESVAIIKQNEKKVNYWVSEPDQGVYNAQNKGIKGCSGEYIFFLNSGDFLVNNNVLSNFIYLLDNRDIVYGNLKIKGAERSWVKTYPKLPSFYYFIDDTIPHSGGAFLKRSLFEKFGYYDEKLKIVADWKFYLTAFASKDLTYKYVNEVFSVFDLDGISSKGENQDLIYKEKSAILEELFPFYYRDMDRVREVKYQYRFLSNSRIVRLVLFIKRKIEIFANNIKNILK